MRDQSYAERQWFDELQRSAQLGVWEWDIVADSITWSDQLYRIYGLDPGAPIRYEDYLERIHPEDRELVAGQVQRAYQTGEPFAFDHRIVRPDGEVRTLHGRGRVLLDDEGRPVRMIGSGQDITERKRAEEEHARLRQHMERMQREFVSMIGHELRNPLTALKGYAQLMQRRQRYDERSVAAIIEQANLLDRMVRDLTDLARFEAGRLALEPAPTDLVELVFAAAERASGRTPAHTIRVEAPGGPLIGSWDRDRLAQVLDNLLSNAIKYSPDGGHIVIRVESGDHHVRVSVQDPGAGIAADELPHLFDRFYRAQKTARSTEGLGLGLFIIRELVEAHGGTVAVHSEGPGKGSTFSFTLPVP